jgi:hypothetical protein
MRVGRPRIVSRTSQAGTSPVPAGGGGRAVLPNATDQLRSGEALRARSRVRPGLAEPFSDLVVDLALG